MLLQLLCVNSFEIHKNTSVLRLTHDKWHHILYCGLMTPYGVRYLGPTTPTHYLNQCCLIISKVFWHSSPCNAIVNTHGINPHGEFETYTFEITTTTLRGQWVNHRQWQYSDDGWLPLTISLGVYFREPVQGSVVVVLPKPRRKSLSMDFELFLQRHDYFGLEKTA